jgi:hypothetical protein
MEERKRLVRCLIREVVLLKDEQPRGKGGITTIRIGWCSGAWSEVHARRPSAADLAGTPQAVLDRIRTLAQQHPDDQVAAILNTEELRTRTGLPWTYLRVGQVRFRQGIPTACPIVPKGAGPRGDGLVPVGAVMEQVGISRSVVSDWCRRGFLHAEQKAALDPRWIRLTEEDLARVDGTRAAQGHGRWHLREAQRVFGLAKEALYQHVREGTLTAYRAHIGDHWEWRVDLADPTKLERPVQPVGVQAASQEVQ